MIPSLEEWPTKAKEGPSPRGTLGGKTDPAEHQPSISMSRGKLPVACHFEIKGMELDLK